MSADKTRDKPGTGEKPVLDDNENAQSGAGTRAKILAAAAELVKEKGAAHISIEAIARRAGLSKGGLLYHFPKKDALLQALVELHMAEVDAMLADVEAANGQRRTNAVARALVELFREKACEHNEKFEGVLMAFAENPHLLDPVRRHEKRLIERIRNTAADHELSLIALLVIEGIRALGLFEMSDLLTDEERRAVLDRVLAMLADDRDRKGQGAAP